MRTIAAFASIAALTLTVFACTNSTEDTSNASDGNVDQGNEQDITSTKNQLQGSWKIDAASKDESSVVSYEFNANGSFSREVNKVLNGVLVAGAPRPTEHQAGKYTVDAAKHIVTLHISTPNEQTETLAYGITPGRVLNGVFLPGSEPNTHPKLNLTQQVPCEPGTACSHIAFPTITYDQATAVGAEGSTCGGFVGLPCQAGLVCKLAASCCDMPGTCVKAGGPPPGAVGLPLNPGGN